MILLDIGDWMQAAAGGSMLLAIPVAFLAGLVSFFSPCVVPLLPGYLAYASGLGVAEVIEGTQRRRMLAGASLFVLGIAVVYVLTGAAIGVAGTYLLTHLPMINKISGVLIIVLGLIFAGLLPLGRRELRVRWVPRVGVAAAPLLGAVFALGWTPCIGPTLGVVLNLALNEGTALRGSVLMFLFALGLGLPFVLAGLAYTRMAGATEFVRRHQVAVQRIGGGLMVAVGVLMLTGWWERLLGMLRQAVASFVPVI